ncbi:MAG: hypothetical protein K2I73_02845 [Eubacterium sp.]|nr:hypothetical protein [Eubacterium sp.]
MKNEDKIQLLKSEPMKFTYAEIEQIMDNEIDKDPSEMDTELIDFCAKVLCQAIEAQKENEVNTKSVNKKHIKLKLTKIFAAALITILILGGAMTVSAKYIYNDTSDKIVKFYADHFSINLRGTNSNNDTQLDDSADLIAKLKDSGFDKVILPNDLLTEDYKYDVDITEDDKFLTTSITIKQQNDNNNINIDITKYKNGIDNLFNSETQITNEYDSAKQLSKNGIDIFVFGNKEYSSIIYVDNNTYYDIYLTNFDFNSAIKIAESIK